VDTTSFSVSGEYEPDFDGHTIAVTYGYSRDHRADRKQWMLALATTRDGDIPLFLQPLDGNMSDQVSLLAAVEALCEQLGADAAEEQPLFVADSGLYSALAMTRLNRAGVRWVSRVPATLTEAQLALVRADAPWQTSADAKSAWWSQELTLAQGRERWLVVRTEAGVHRARATMERQAAKALAEWEKRLWHLSHRAFACEADARRALELQATRLPTWLTLQPAAIRSAPRHGQRGRPAEDAMPQHTDIFIAATVLLDTQRLTHEVERAASYIVATNVLDPMQLADTALVQRLLQNDVSAFESLYDRHSRLVYSLVLRILQHAGLRFSALPIAGISPKASRAPGSPKRA
jgi:transposase